MEKKKENFNNNADFYADTMEHEEAKKIRSALSCEDMEMVLSKPSSASSSAQEHRTSSKA